MNSFQQQQQSNRQPQHFPEPSSSFQTESNQKLDAYWSQFNEQNLPMHAVLQDSDVVTASSPPVTGDTEMPSANDETSVSSTNTAAVRLEAQRVLEVERLEGERTTRLPSQTARASATALVIQDASSAMRSEAYQQRVAEARAEMLELLEARLHAKCGAASNKTQASSSSDSMNVDDSNPQQAGEEEPAAAAAAVAETTNSSSNKDSTAVIQQTAKTLEGLLFQQSNQNLKLYQDISTLDSRLRDLMIIVVRRRMMKRAGRDSSSSNSRKRISQQQRSSGSSTTLQSKAMQRLHPNSTTSSTTTTSTTTSTKRAPAVLSTRTQFLLRLLSKAKYNEITKLLQEIRLAKMEKVATFCGSRSCTLNTQCAKTFDTQLPKVVRQLYFETPLVDCFERYPLERLQQLPWDELVHQAQSNLLNYQLWEMKLGGGS